MDQPDLFLSLFIAPLMRSMLVSSLLLLFISVSTTVINELSDTLIEERERRKGEGRDMTVCKGRDMEWTLINEESIFHQ